MQNVIRVENGRYLSGNVGDVEERLEAVEQNVEQLNSDLSEIPLIQHGQAHTGTNGLFSVTFPTQYQYAPHVCVTWLNGGGSSIDVVISVKDVTTSGFLIISTSNGSTLEADVQWIAIGK